MSLTLTAAGYERASALPGQTQVIAEAILIARNASIKKVENIR